MKLKFVVRLCVQFGLQSSLPITFTMRFEIFQTFAANRIAALFYPHIVFDCLLTSTIEMGSIRFLANPIFHFSVARAFYLATRDLNILRIHQIWN